MTEERETLGSIAAGLFEVNPHAAQRYAERVLGIELALRFEEWSKEDQELARRCLREELAQCVRLNQRQQTLLADLVVERRPRANEASWWSGGGHVVCTKDGAISTVYLIHETVIALLHAGAGSEPPPPPQRTEVRERHAHGEAHTFQLTQTSADCLRQQGISAAQSARFLRSFFDDARTVPLSGIAAQDACAARGKTYFSHAQYFRRGKWVIARHGNVIECAWLAEDRHAEDKHVG